jgi:hypothetical protein
MRLKRTSFFLVTASLIVLLGLVSCGGTVTSTPPTTSPPLIHSPKVLESKTIQFGGMPWEFSLYSITWNGLTVTADISVTYKYRTVNSFPFVFVAEDAYRVSFQPVEGPRPAFCSGIFYPEDTKRGTLTFTVNPKSGNIVLETFDGGSLKRETLFTLGSAK